MCRCFAAMVAETELFWGGGLFNMIRWVICVICIVVDNLGCCRLGRSKEIREVLPDFR